MSIYTITYSTSVNLLLPPNKRTTKIKAFLAALMKPMQWNSALFSEDYIEGMEYPAFNGFAVYFPGTRITYTDNRNYERIYQNNALPVSGQPPDAFPDYWILIQDNFIGARNRAQFNGQIIMLENQLNYWFRNPLPADQIYIGNNVNQPNFWLGASGATSSKMSNLSQYSTSYLANVNNPGNSDFTVYVPVALSNTWTNDVADTAPNISANRENKVRRFVDKYKLAGITYNVITY